MPTLKPICLARCLATLALHAHAGARCSDWGTSAFFDETVTAADVRRCLEGGANIDAQQSNGVTALHNAAFFGRVEAVTALLDAGANIEARMAAGTTALHWAAKNGHVETVTTLLDAGADPKAKDVAGNFPFDLVEDDSPLKGTDAYWRLHDARY